MIAMYVLLDGFDLGRLARSICWVAKTDEERRQGFWASIGPVWDGNEVWLIRRGRNDVFSLSPRASMPAGFSGLFNLAADDCLWLSDSSWSGRSNSGKSHQKAAVWDPPCGIFFFLRIESATGRILRSGAG